MLVIACVVCCVSVPTAAKELKNLCGSADTPIDEKAYVDVGGIKQWITLKGERCANPVILFVHGGPGNPASLYSDSLYKAWETQFTLAHWDQRGSGKTWQANQKAGELTEAQLHATPLTVELLVSDGLAVTSYVLDRLGKNKLIITGTSWGSVLAVKMIRQQPASYYFYVGLSQIVNYHADTAESYALVLAMAQQKNDQPSLEILKAVGPPPWTSPASFGKLRRIVRRYESEVTGEMPETKPADEYLAQASRDAYYAGEEFSFLKFVGLHADGMAQGITLDKDDTKFEIPVYLLQGRQDLLTVPKVTESYFEKLKAPEKHYIEVEHCGHDPNRDMLREQLEVLRAGYKSATGG